MNDSQVAIRVTDVTKRFVIRKEKSLKERIVNFGRSNLHKEDFIALDGVSMDIMQGSTVGLIGPNGSGKSTLLKTVGGIIQPTTGSVQHRGRVAALLELGAGFHPDLTGRENVYLNASILGLSKQETDDNFAAILEFAGIGNFIDIQVKFYSSGMYVRLAFAVAVHVDPDILIVDEVLAVGDEPFQRKCLDRIRDLQRQNKTIVLVTHALNQVAELCDRAIVLEHGTVVFDGEPNLAIRTLRQDFEQIRVEAAEAAAAAEAAKRDEEFRATLPTIDHVELKSRDGREVVSTIQSGDGLVLEIELTIPELTDQWIIGMGIDSTSGQVIFGTNSDRLELARTPVKGAMRFRFAIDSLHLGEGQYFLHASYGTVEVNTLVRVDHAAVFTVIEPSRNLGVIRATVSGEMTTEFERAAVPAGSAN